MLSDSSFRRTTKCNYYKNLLATKQIPEFPIQRVSPEFLNTNDLIHSTGFNKPFVITESSFASSSDCALSSKESPIGIILPGRDKDLTFVSEVVGAATPVKIIEVGQQAEITDWTLGEYSNYLKHYRAEDHKILNMITLEFSNTPLNSKVQAPKFVRDLDWIDTIWPLARRARGDYPKVQKYCLAGMAGSYTDFHIDFGGTSVWYHVLNGRKRFFLVPPTTANLRAFEKWTTSSAQADVFFGDLLEPAQCFQFDLNPGETFMIPSGWIHAVFTPVDSLVFGGNFVHAYAMLRQLQIYSIEHRTRVQKAYRFPFFRQINWYFLCTILPVAKEMYSAEKAASSSWVDDMMSDDDEQDDLEVICGTLKDPMVLLQLPYLVKMCEKWHKSGSDGQEKGVFDVSIKDTGCASVEEIFSEWWKLMFAIATRLPKCTSDQCTTTATEAHEHISRIQGMEVLDLLDDQVVRPVFQAFESDLRAQLLSVVPPVVPTAPVAFVESASAPLTSAGDAAEGGAGAVGEPPLRLKLSLKKAPLVSAAAAAAATSSSAVVPTAVSADIPPSSVPAVPEYTDAPSAPVSADIKAPAETKRKISLIAPSATAEATEENNSSGAKPAKRFKLTLGAQPEKAARKSNGNTVAAQRSAPARNYDHSRTEDYDGSGRRYGTRGLKLSADFLSRVMDVEVGGEGDGDNIGQHSNLGGGGSGSEPEGDVEEEYEEPAAWRSNTSSSRRSGPSEKTVFLDQEGGDEWRQQPGDTAGAAGRQGTSSSFRRHFDESGEEDSDHVLDLDADEDFSDDGGDGFIVDDSDRKSKKRKTPNSKGHVTGTAKGALPVPKPQYFVDRLSEPAGARSYGSSAGPIRPEGSSNASVPQIQGVRSQLLNSSSAAGRKPSGAPANNRLKIMKKLGLKL